MEPNDQLGETKILENQRLRAWEDVVAPGQSGPSHTHHHPFFAVIIDGGHGEVIAEDGNVVDSYQFKRGETYYFGEDKVPVTHAIRNAGESTIKMIIIEFL